MMILHLAKFFLFLAWKSSVQMQSFVKYFQGKSYELEALKNTLLFYFAEKILIN